MSDDASAVWNASKPVDDASAVWEASKPVIDSKQVAHGVIASFLAGTGKGFGKSVLGLQQLAGKGLTALGSDKVGPYLADDAQQGIAKLNDEAAPYEQQHPTATFAGDIAGQVANPVNYVVPMGGIAGRGIAAATPALVARGMGQGFISAAATPVENTDNYWTSKAGQVALGTAAGGILTPVANAATDLGTNAVMRGVGAVKKVTGGITQSAVDAVIAKTAQAQGVDLSHIAASDMTRIRGQVADAMAKGKTFDAAGAVRMAEGDSVLGDAGLTVGQATRDPGQFSLEKNIRGTDAGRPLMDRYAAQSGALVNALNTRGAKSPLADEAFGNVLGDSLRASDKADASNVTDLYNAFRKAEGGDIELPGTTLADAAGKVIDKFGDENIPGAVMAKLNSYGFLGGTKTKSFNLDEADKLLKSINANYDPMKKAQAGALGDLRTAVKQTFADEAAKASDAGSAYAPALKAATDRFTKHDETPALSAAVENTVEPNKFFNKFILNGSPRQIQSMASSLDDGAKQAVREKILNHLKTSALSGAQNDDATFVQAGYNKALSGLSDERLAPFFTPDEIADLHKVGRVAFNVQYAPAGNVVNGSNTAVAAYNFLSGLAANTPFVSAINKGVDKAAKAVSVRNALAGKVPAETVEGPVNALRPFLLPLTGAGASSAADLMK